MKLNKNNIKNLNISTRLLAERAIEKGYHLEYYQPSANNETGIIKCTKENIEFQFKSTATSLTPSYGYFSAEDKILTFNLLSGHDVPTPKTIEVSIDKIPSNLDFSKNRYVVKPVDMNHGDGVTTGIASLNELKTAINHASNISLSNTVIVQEQVYGKEYRFLVIAEEVFAVAGREPPTVVGNGVSSIKELIENLNKDPRRGEGHKASLTKVNIAEVAIVHGNDYLKIVPRIGEKMKVLDTSNLSKGGQAIDYTNTASDELKKIALRASKACSLGIAGVDIITDSINNPSEYGSFVIEVNLAPGLRMHHFPSEGIERDAAGRILEVLESKAISRNSKPSLRANDYVMIGVSTHIDFVGYKKLKKIPVRIDTGARTSSLWASSIKIEDDNKVRFKMFGPGSKYYTNKYVTMPFVEHRTVTSSTGHEQERIVVKFPIRIKGKKIQAKFTLSDRSTQSYPILIGRNTLRGHFLVDSSDPGEAAIYKYPEEKDEFKEVEA